MNKRYFIWVKEHWQKASILVFIYIMFTLLPLYFTLEFIEFMLLLAFPLYLIHEIEEYIIPGGFDRFFNENLLGISCDSKIVPVDESVIFWINFIYIWLTIPLFSALGFLHLSFSAWIPYFFIFQAFGHLVMGVKGKKLINPGIRSSFILHLPYAFIMIHQLYKNNIIHNVYWNFYLVIGFAFNILLPVFAKYYILPRYYKRIKE